MRSGQRRNNDGLVVGLDCSTTATKAIAFNRRGDIAAHAVEAIPLLSPRPDYYEQDSLEWWRSAQKALKRITHQVDAGRIAALAVSNQRETFVPLGSDGKALRPAIVWLDERCKDEVEPFSQRIGKATIHRITGKPADYAPVVYRLAWMKRHEQRLFKHMRMICDVQTYLVWRLTGTYVTSWASADPLGMFDLRNKAWSPVILRALELKNTQLPVVCRPGSVLGTITKDAAKATGLSPTTAIVAGGGDGQAAAVGGNVLSPGRAYLNLGTAVVAGVYGTRYRTSRAFRTMCSCSERGYCYECSLRAGTFSIDWLVQRILNINPRKQRDIYALLEREAEQVNAGSDGLLHLPYLCGVMNPFWDMNARGAFVGLSSSHQRGHVYRSILEGIAFEVSAQIKAVERTVGAKVHEFVAIGGGTASDLWCHIFADITGKRVRIPDNTEASARGAAIAAAVGAGWYRTFREAATGMTGRSRTMKPNQRNRKRYTELSAIYQTIYPRLKGVGKENGVAVDG
jgi:xylulokinase